MAKELVLRKDELQNQTVETIYFGGGTPSLLTTNELQFLINSVFENYKVSNNQEITLEANPDDLTNKCIDDLAQSQINRLSIGIQSFFDGDLRSMNRAHNSEEAKRCLETATRHFDNITIDLIYGIPSMSLEKWNKNLQMAFGFGVNHISSYALTVEPKTALHSFIKKGTYPVIDDNLALQHFNHLIEETAKQGFIQYEISNFGKPDYFSRHNSSYWQGRPYLGIGPSAHSFRGEQRSWNIANNSKYIEALMKDELPRTIEKLSIQDRFNEYIMTGLRTMWGISLHEIEQQFGSKYKEHLLASANKYLTEGLLAIVNPSTHGKRFGSEINFADFQTKGDGGILKVTEKGKFLVDGIASNLFMI